MEASGDEPALMPKVAKLGEDMKSFEGGVHDLVINDTNGKPIHSSNHDRRFFEAAWYEMLNCAYETRCLAADL